MLGVCKEVISTLTCIFCRGRSWEKHCQMPRRDPIDNNATVGFSLCLRGTLNPYHNFSDFQQSRAWPNKHDASISERVFTQNFISVRYCAVPYSYVHVIKWTIQPPSRIHLCPNIAQTCKDLDCVQWLSIQTQRLKHDQPKKICG